MCAAALSLLGPPGLVAQVPPAREPPPPARVLGTVYDHERLRPIAGATVTLAGAAQRIATRETDAEGRFLFDAVPPGPVVVAVAAMGYTSVMDTLAVRAGADHDLAIELSIEPVAIAPLVTVVYRTPLMLQGFDERRRTGRGTFITRDDVEARNPTRVSDLLRTVPGAEVVPLASGGYGLRLRGRCVPALWVNGTRTVDDPRFEVGVDALVPAEVEGIEVYTGAAAVPAQFGPESCGAVLVWTRPASRREGKGTASALMRLSLAAAVILLGLVVVR